MDIWVASCNEEIPSKPKWLAECELQKHLVNLRALRRIKKRPRKLGLRLLEENLVQL